MYTINEIYDKDEKNKITLDILNCLPQWFSPPEDIQKKAKIHRDLPLYAVMTKDKIIGFIALKIHNPYTVEIYTLAILQEYHKKGIGKDLIKVCEHDYKVKGYQFLTVKTLDESAAYEPYDYTRLFYKKYGFIPLEVFHTYWDKDNPCLFLLKCIE